MNFTRTPSKHPVQAGVSLRVLIFLALGLALLIALFYGEEDFKGARRWNRFKSAAAAEGEKLNVADFVPPEVPDEKNFAMTPLLRVNFDYLHTTNGVRWRDSNAWQRLSNIRIDLAPRGLSVPKFGEQEEDSAVDLKAFAEFYRGNTNYPQSPPTATPAEVVLTALNKFEPEFKELREAAARPYSRFPIEYSYEPPAAILLPHLAHTKGLSLVCDLRAIAELDAGRSADALADLQLGFYLSAAIRDEPFLIDHLVRIATLNLTAHTIGEGLARHAWSDAELATLETNLASIDLLAEYGHAMRGERAFTIAGLDYLRRTGVSTMLDQPDEIDSARAFRCLPGGWYYQNMTLVGECFRDYLLPSVDASNRVVTPVLGEMMWSDLTKRRLSPYNVFAKMLLPAFNKASQRTARAQTRLDETRIACALERYRIQHNELPPTLEALSPQFLPAIPTDLFDGKPLRYKADSNGTYLLYSIGWNETDDGGVAAKTKTNTPHPDWNNGDWVWSLPVKQMEREQTEKTETNK